MVQGSERERGASSGASTSESLLWSARLVTASASLAMLGVSPQGAQASVVKVTTKPFVYDLRDPNPGLWDVDGDANPDFTFSNLYISRINVMYGRGSQGSGPPAPAAGFFATNGAGSLVKPLASGDAIQSGGTNQWVSPFVALYSRSATDRFVSATLSQGAFRSGFSFGAPYYFGFRFKGDATNPRFGYGIISFDKAAKSLTISRWAYEPVPGDPITVGPIESVPGPIGLAGLAAGAAWTRKLRRRIRKSA